MSLKVTPRSDSVAADDVTVVAAASQPTIDITQAAEPAILEAPKPLASASSMSSLVNLVAREPGASLTGSQILREELWNAKELLAPAEDSVSVSSDVSSVSKKPKKKTFFSFGRKKEKQKEIM